MTPAHPSSLRPYAPSTWQDLNAGIGDGGFLDFTTEGFDFDDADMGFIDQLCTDFHGTDSNNHPQLQVPRQAPETTGPGNSQRHAAALGAEAYKRSSFGVWHPARNDYGGAELENLSVPSVANGSPETQLAIDYRRVGENLSRTTRDEFLAMILRTCKPERLHYVFRAFPTPEFLDELLQSFFSHHYQRTDSFIHIPSFRPNQQKPELLGAIAATGAILTDIRSVHKLGFAMQEAVRATIQGRCEESNAATRELWVLQAFICELEVGLWSGIKRKMEIAESHPQVVFTVCFD